MQKKNLNEKISQNLLQVFNFINVVVIRNVGCTLSHPVKYIRKWVSEEKNCILVIRELFWHTECDDDPLHDIFHLGMT